MDILTLTIEAADAQNDAAEQSVTVDAPVFQVGRRPGSNWVLPDPSRFISGTHLEIRQDGDRFVLYDLSTNGTFVNGAKQRLAAPHPIADGDVFKVGLYTLRAGLTALTSRTSTAHVQTPAHMAMATKHPSPRRAPPAAISAARPRGGDRSAIQAPPGARVSAVPPEVQEATPEAPIQDTPPEHVADSRPPQPLDSDNRPVEPPQPAPPVDLIPDDDFQTPGPFEQDAVAPSNAGQNAVTTAEAAEPVAPDVKPSLDITTGLESHPPVGLGERFGAVPQPPTPAAEIEKQPDQAPAPAEAAQPPSDVPDTTTTSDNTTPSTDAFMRGFLEGAGLDPQTEVALSPEELGRLLGLCARTGTDMLMQMLTDRSAVKLLVVHEDRTMLTVRSNNPMKFMPDADEAFDTMFVSPRQGYMTGAEGFENALEDLRRHNAALMAAIQPALADMMYGLSPDEIADSVSGGVLGSASRKSWEEFVSRWESRAAEGEHGMLDVFLKAFARHYSDALNAL